MNCWTVLHFVASSQNTKKGYFTPERLSASTGSFANRSPQETDKKLLKSSSCLCHESSFIRYMQFMSINLVQWTSFRRNTTTYTYFKALRIIFFWSISMVICFISSNCWNVIFISFKYLISVPSETFIETSLLGDHKISTRIPWSFMCRSRCLIICT